MSDIPTTRTILSLLNGTPEQEIKRCLAGQHQYKIITCSSNPPPAQFDTFLSAAFWQAISARPFDIALLPLDRTALACLDSHSPLPPGALWPWTQTHAAVIAVLSESESQYAVAANQYDFAGIIAPPLDLRLVQSVLLHAVKRHQARLRIMKRYDKIVALLRRVNGEQKRLQQKVNLVCQDLVQSNIELTRSITTLREAYEFQIALTGEFDLKPLLHKALAAIKQKCPDTNISVYLCQSRQFEAHIVANWHAHAQELESLETALYQTILPLSIHKPLLITEAASLPNLTVQQQQRLENLSVLAIPLRLEQPAQGVLFLYRPCENPMTNAERLAIMPLIAPLTRALESHQRLNDQLACLTE